jgi:transposase-like protein
MRLRDGEPVPDIAVETGISPAELFRWKAQALVDAGVRDGVPSVEAEELAARRMHRFARLEAELALTRDACALFDAQVVKGPKGKRPATRRR